VERPSNVDQGVKRSGGRDVADQRTSKRFSVDKESSRLMESSGLA